MKLTDLLEKYNIIHELKAVDKKRAIEELVQTLIDSKPSLDKDSLVRVLLERETLGSTGIGEGVAIPHGKFPGISEPIISFGRSIKGLDFDSMDGQPVHLFFLLIAPDTSASVHLKALARIAKLLKNGAFRKMLMEASTRDEIYEIIVKNDEDF
jgi:PTS system nitrogen regulatory IIA component